eukprot:gene22287-29365_t
MLTTSTQRAVHAQAMPSPRLSNSLGSSSRIRTNSNSHKGRRPLSTPVSAHIEIASALSMLDPAHLHQIMPHLPLAYEPVAAPCSLMKCGDVEYRSTLDLVLRGEDGGFTWRGYLLLASIFSYFFLPPGPIPGAIDYYINSKIYRNNAKNISRDDIRLGRKLASGGFGSVFSATLKDKNNTEDDIRLGRKLASGGFGSVFRATLKDKNNTEVIVKKAKEFGEAEVWMNERMMRVDGAEHCAELVAAFDQRDGAGPGTSPLDSDIWLVWKFEGDNTLNDVMEKRDFPYNMETILLGRELNLPKGPRRRLVTVKLALKQLIEALDCCHRTGIVHRDVKPQNCIVSQGKTGVGKIKLIDLGAAADLRIGINYVPREYLLDPSVGVSMLQMSFPGLRNDNAIITFNKPSAAESLNHPWFTGSANVAQNMSSLYKAGTRAVSSGISTNSGYLQDTLNAGKADALTEASIYRELGLEDSAPVAARGASNTIAWWQERKSELKRKKGKEEGGSNGSSSSNGSGKNRSGAPDVAPARKKNNGASSASENIKTPGWFSSKTAKKKPVPEPVEEEEVVVPAKAGFKEVEEKKPQALERKSLSMYPCSPAGLSRSRSAMSLAVRIALFREMLDKSWRSAHGHDPGLLRQLMIGCDGS